MKGRLGENIWNEIHPQTIYRRKEKGEIKVRPQIILFLTVPGKT